MIISHVVIYDLLEYPALVFADEILCAMPDGDRIQLQTLLEEDLHSLVDTGVFAHARLEAKSRRFADA